MIFNYNILLDLFESVGENFATWAAKCEYTPDRTDEWIYTHLPPEIKDGRLRDRRRAWK